MAKHLISPKIQNMMDIKKVLLQWFINILIKKTSGSGMKLVEELQKSIIKKLKKKKSTITFHRQYLGY